MRPVLSCDEVRRLEDVIEKEGTSKAELMEFAGEFVASEALKGNPSRVVILVGFGNNGGDGWVAADILAQKDVHVDVVSPVEPDEISAPLARHVARRTAGRDVNIVVGPSKDELSELIGEADLVIDAILGTGFHGELRPPFSIWVPVVNELEPTVLSVLMRRRVWLSMTAYELPARRPCLRPSSGYIVPTVPNMLAKSCAGVCMTSLMR